MAEHSNSTIKQNVDNQGVPAHYATINGDNSIIGTNLNKSVIVASDMTKEGAAASVGVKGKLLLDSVSISGHKSRQRPGEVPSYLMPKKSIGQLIN